MSIVSRCSVPRFLPRQYGLECAHLDDLVMFDGDNDGQNECDDRNDPADCLGTRQFRFAEAGEGVSSLHGRHQGGVRTQVLWRQKQPLPVDGLVVGLDVAHRAPFLPWHHLGCSIIGHGRQRCDAGWCSARLESVGVVPREDECVREGRVEWTSSRGPRGRDTDAGDVLEAQARQVIAQGGRHCTASDHARRGACGISIRWAKHGEAPGKSLFPPAVGQPGQRGAGPDVSRQALWRQCGCLHDDRVSAWDSI